VDEGGGGDGGIWADPEALGAPEALQQCSPVEGCPIVLVYTD
nr:hypothetical protein [Tanacetum cinerariifolium]